MRLRKFVVFSVLAVSLLFSGFFGVMTPQAYATQNKTYEFILSDSTQFESIKFTAVDPNNPEQKIEITERGKSYSIPEGYLLSGEMVMNATRVISGTGDGDLPISKFSITSSGIGKSAKLTYSLKDFIIKDNINFHGLQTQPTNYAHYVLKGGTWTDSHETDLAGGKGADYYQIFITPYGTVYQPKDPIREGYTFKGWYVESQLDKDFNAENKKKIFDPRKGDFYKFDEVDPNIAVKYIRGRIVTLVALWEKDVPLTPLTPIPDPGLKNVEINKGDNFKPSSMFDEETLNAINSGEYRLFVDPDTIVNTCKVGDYKVKFTLISKDGSEVKKEATLTVKADTETPSPATSDNDNSDSKYTGFYSNKSSDMASDNNGSNVSDDEKVVLVEKRYDNKALPKTSDIASVAAPLALVSLLALGVTRYLKKRA